MRSILILMATGGAVALSGVRIPEPAWVPALFSSRLFAEALTVSAPVITSGGAVSEAVSLLVLGSGFFAAAVVVRRRG